MRGFVRRSHHSCQNLYWGISPQVLRRKPLQEDHIWCPPTYQLLWYLYTPVSSLSVSPSVCFLGASYFLLSSRPLRHTRSSHIYLYPFVNKQCCRLDTRYSTHFYRLAYAFEFAYESLPSHYPGFGLLVCFASCLLSL